MRTRIANHTLIFSGSKTLMLSPLEEEYPAWRIYLSSGLEDLQRSPTNGTELSSAHRKMPI